MKSFTTRAIQKLVAEYLSGFVLDAPVDKDKLNVDKMRRQSARIIKSQAYQVCVRAIVDEIKNKMALQALTEEEMFVNRGMALGIQLLDRKLNEFTAGVTTKDYEDDI